MALRINELEGVTLEIGAALVEAGLNDSDKLLAATAQPTDRAKLAARLGIEDRAVLELANRADLARVKGIGQIYSDLLEFAGVDTVAELRQRNADNLFDKLVEVAGGHHVQRLPRRADVHDWVAQAKRLERAIFF
jgi:predicted flap endonuclease-1-like 5' DNA nuclease